MTKDQLIFAMNRDKVVVLPPQTKSGTEFHEDPEGLECLIERIDRDGSVHQAVLVDFEGNEYVVDEQDFSDIRLGH